MGNHKLQVGFKNQLKDLAAWKHTSVMRSLRSNGKESENILCEVQM